MQKKEDHEGDQSGVIHETPVESPSQNYLVVETLQKMPAIFSRGLLYLVILFLLVALIYSLVGSIDIVSECRAVAIPTTNQLSVLATRGGYVQRIFISEGQMVEANTPLFSIRTDDLHTPRPQSPVLSPEPTMRRKEGEGKISPDTSKKAETALPAITVGEDTSPGSGNEEIIRAERSGTLIKLFVESPGEYVAASTPLCTILPVQDQLHMNLFVTNRDIGFIEKNMQIKYKFDAFPYTDCGVLYGKVSSIPSAAIEDRTFGLVYHVRGTLDMSCYDVGGKQYPLKAGMTATAELVRERKSIFSILFKKLRG